MNCPRCEHQNSKVLESRVTDAGDAMRRRRECLDCRLRYTTYERVELPTLLVAKHTGEHEAFDRAKLMQGLVRACNKRDVPLERLEALVLEIEGALRKRQTRTISSEEIGELALEGLLRLDQVAYVRFASVYRAFDDIDEFHQELDRIAATVCPVTRPAAEEVLAGRGASSAGSASPGQTQTT